MLARRGELGDMGKRVIWGSGIFMEIVLIRKADFVGCNRHMAEPTGKTAGGSTQRFHFVPLLHYPALHYVRQAFSSGFIYIYS